MTSHCQMSSVIHFFKIILQHSLQQGKLKLPERFIGKYGKGMPNPVYMKLPDGTKWEIYWKKYENGEVCLEKGWDEVVRYYSLCHGHLILFKYERTSTCYFHVNIFDKSAVEIDYPLHRNHIQQISDDGDDDDDSVEIIYEKPQMHKKASQKPRLSPSSNRPCKKIRAQEAERRSKKQKMCSDGKKLKSVKAEPTLTKLKSEEIVGRSKLSTKKSSKPMAIKKLKKEPVTCEEKGRALQRVNTFVTKNPYFKIVMQPTYIKNRLNIPADFVRENLMMEKERNVLLRVSDGRTWLVKCYGEEGKKHRLRIRRGWPSFVEDNNLKVGDVCVFELTNTIDVSFLVHVFGDSAFIC